MPNLMVALPNVAGAVCQCPSSTSTSSQLHELEAAVELLDADNDALRMHCAAD